MIRKIPEVNIKKDYFLYLFLIFILSTLLHEMGHALAVFIRGGTILSFQLVDVRVELRFDDSFFVLGGLLTTLIICLFATFEIFRHNSDKWLAAIFANLRLITLIPPQLPRDEAFFVNNFKISSALIFTAYLIVYSFPIFVLIKAPKLSPRKKIVFYLYNIVVILAAEEFLEILNSIIFK